MVLLCVCTVMMGNCIWLWVMVKILGEAFLTVPAREGHSGLGPVKDTAGL